MKKSDAIFAALCRSEGLPDPVTEHRFHPVRKWRFDYAWPKHLVALEVEGGVWIAGRHTRGAGFVSDMEKYSEAAIFGWAVIRVLPSDLCKKRTIELVGRALTMKGFRVQSAEAKETEVVQLANRAQRRPKGISERKTQKNIEKH